MSDELNLTPEELEERRRQKRARRLRQKKRERRRRMAIIIIEVLLLLVIGVCAYVLAKFGGITVLTPNTAAQTNATGETEPVYTTPEEMPTLPKDSEQQPDPGITEPSTSESNIVIHTLPGETTQQQSSEVDLTKLFKSDYTTFAVLGVDAEGDNTDVMLIVSLENKTKQVRMVSVYRDTWLYMMTPGKFDRANQMYCRYANGSFINVISMLNVNLDLSIDYYAIVNWKVVAELINVLGGIELEITNKDLWVVDEVHGGYKPYINGLITEIVKNTGIGSSHFEEPGTYLCDGVQAVAYCRLRYNDSDFTRTQRQRDVISAMLEKLKKADIFTLDQVLTVITRNISTTISSDKILSMATGLMSYRIVAQGGFPTSYYDGGGYTGSQQWAVMPRNLAENVRELHATLYPNKDYTPSKTVMTITNLLKQIGKMDDDWNTPWEDEIFY